jgi:hypothetical protein
MSNNPRSETGCANMRNALQSCLAMHVQGWAVHSCAMQQPNACRPLRQSQLTSGGSLDDGLGNRLCLSAS